MSITYKVRFVNFDGFEFDRAPSAVFVKPTEKTFGCFLQELKNRAPILSELKVVEEFKLFYLDKERNKIEIKDNYDFKIFERKGIINLNAEYQLPEFADFDEFAEYVTMFTPDGKFPGF